MTRDPESHSGLRKEVVPRPPHDPSATASPRAPGDQLELALDAESDEPQALGLAAQARVCGR